MAQLQIYLISNTAGDQGFAIQPQTYNGPGGVQQTTDLTLYGNGAENWGQEFNENFYRLLENWAVGSKYDLNVANPIDQPLNANDLSGEDVGINKPITGQMWFNKTNNYLYVYNGSTWQLSSIQKGTTPPSNPTVGSLWFDTNNTRLKTYNGSSWVSHVLLDGDTMTGSLTLNGDPTNPLGASTKQYTDTKVSLSGDTMTGSLTLNGDPTNPLEASTKQYVDNLSFNDLSNVNTSPSDGDLLVYDSGSGIWIETSPERYSTPPGCVQQFAGGTSSVPLGWLLCNGQPVSRTTYSALYNMIGTTFGNGDGSTTFNLPDVRDRVPVGSGAMGVGDSGRIDNHSTDLGDVGGEDQHQLTVDEMPNHNHDLVGNDAGANGQPLAPGLYADNTETTATNDSIGTTGGDQPHNNMPPFIVFNYIIKT